MDDRTVRYYDENAGRLCALYASAQSGVDRYFAAAFPPGSEILDIGCGSGRDIGILLKERYDAYGAEPSAGLRALAADRSPELIDRVCAGALPDLSRQIDRKFDGVLCSAVFQHIPAGQQFDAAFDIRNLLKPNGRLLLSFPKERPGIEATGRDEQGRLYTNLIPEEVELLFERLGLDRIGRWDDPDSLGRPGILWTTMLFTLRSDQMLRPIDRIEGVLNRDRKTATYKLALFRALCDIALTRHHLAQWRPDGTVGIPMQEIIERWICYYWPLFEVDEPFIPQIRGESPGRKTVAFRPLLEQLIVSFGRSGGLDAFAATLGNGTFSPNQQTLMERTCRKLAHVLREGPMTHAGLSSRAGRIFDYDGAGRRLILGGGIWRELCLSGHWIQDALILRWSELTSEISGKTISPSQVIDRLLRIPSPRRSIEEARRIYLNLPSKECVWSGAPLQRAFEVDHVLPFSLWRNNDLWNLLPAARSVNRDKGDKLPSHSLLKKRKGAILRCWEALHAASPGRFENEAMRLTSWRPLDLSRTFDCMAEAVEITAIQRGWERWSH